VVKVIPTFGKVDPEGTLIRDADLTAILHEVGDTLRHIRVAQRVQMADLAEMASLSPDTLSRIERGVRDERGLRQLYVTAGMLGVRLSDILRYAELCAMELGGPWPGNGANSPLVAAILGTAPVHGLLTSQSNI
jgi:hypothetical protein